MFEKIDRIDTVIFNLIRPNRVLFFIKNPIQHENKFNKKTTLLIKKDLKAYY